jgi:hypothetical protein
MARIRTIKPDFWSDDVITECSLSARLLFIGTWNFADDSGNLDRSAKQIKARVFPVDNIDCEPLIQELLSHGLLIEYSVSGKTYLHINGFDKHQVINRPSKPTCPEYAPNLASEKHSVSPHVPLTTEGKGKEGKGSVVRETPLPKDFAISERVKKWADEKGHTQLERHLEHFLLICQAKGYKYKDWDSAFMRAITDNWAKVQPKEENWYQKSLREGKVL